MARNTVQEWDTNPDLNTDIAGINIAENCPPGGINDAIRRIMAQIAVWAVTIGNSLPKSGGAMTGSITDMGSGSTVKTQAGVSQPVGTRTIPSRSITAAGALVLADAGGAVKTTGGDITIPTNATAAFAVDEAILIINRTADTRTITPAGSVVLRQAGTTNTGARSLAGWGQCTVVKVATDEWSIVGAGVS